MRACDRRRPPHKELCEIKSRLSAAGTLLPLGKRGSWVFVGMVFVD